MENAPNDVKILQLIDTYYPTVDGAINVAKFYCKELNKLTECKLAAPKPAKKAKYFDKEEFEVLRCSSAFAPEKYRSALPEQDVKFVKRIKTEHFDIFHAQSPFTMGRFAIKMAKKKGIPVVATLHTQYHQDFERVLKFKPFTEFMIKYILKVYKKADSVWTVSERSCQILRDYGYKGKIEVVRNGTDLVYPDNAQQLIEKINERHNLEGQKNVFLFVGRMAWYKNLKIILDAISILKNKGKDFKMVFVGGGFDYKEVVKYAEDKGLSDCCIFTGAVKDKALMQGYYLRADLLFLPSTFDMAPVTAVEAAAHNLSAVMTRGSCSAEQVEDGVNGFLADENAESFAEVTERVMDSPELLEKAGLEAHKTLYRSWDMVAKEVYEKYKVIISEYKQKQAVKEQEKLEKKLKKQKEEQ